MPRELTDALPSVHHAMSNGRALGVGGREAPLATYGAVVEHALSELEVVHRRGSPVAAKAAARIIETLRRHVTLLEGTGDEQVRRLVDLAHETFDLRALGFVQAASGSQRWYPRPATYHARGGERLAVAAELEHARQPRRRPATDLAAPEHAGAICVSHIQRLGHDVADHVIICRTLRHHMPCTSRGTSRESEAALFYRAVASARRSVHILSVDMSPFLLQPIRDHRREEAKA